MYEIPVDLFTAFYLFPWLGFAIPIPPQE